MTVPLILFFVLLAANLLLWVALVVSAIKGNAQFRRDVDAELAKRKPAPIYGRTPASIYGMVEGQ